MRTPHKQTFLQLLLVLGLCPTLPAIAASNGEFDALLRQAEDGSVEAQYEVGRLYYNGEGIPQDRGEALKWFLKAGEQQHAQAAFALGTIYDEKGQGVTQNRVEAYRWYNLAAASGM